MFALRPGALGLGQHGLGRPAFLSDSVRDLQGGLTACLARALPTVTTVVVYAVARTAGTPEALLCRVVWPTWPRLVGHEQGRVGRFTPHRADTQIALTGETAAD